MSERTNARHVNSKYYCLQAVEYYKKSMLIHAKLERPVEYADSLNNLGVMLMKSGDYEQAADFCSKALKVHTV